MPNPPDPPEYEDLDWEDADFEDCDNDQPLTLHPHDTSTHDRRF